MKCLYCSSQGHTMQNCPELYPRGRPIPPKNEVIELKSPYEMVTICAAEEEKSLQDRVIDAVEKARTKQATGFASHEYNLGYAEAKRDVLIEVAQVFAEEEASRASTSRT